jgi:hypothetical protein
MLYDMILFNFFFFALQTFSFISVELKLAHFEVEIIVAQAEITAQGPERLK